MYSQQCKISLKERIGWADVIQPNYDIEMNSDNLLSNSGRYFSSFHNSAIAENVYKTIYNLDISNDDFNDYLAKMKLDCVNEVLDSVFDNNPLANLKENEDRISCNFKEDYSEDILSKLHLFDKAIGYCMANKCLRLFITTIRSNELENKFGQSYELLKSELEGIKNQQGGLIAKGVVHYYEESIKNVIDILFPIQSKFKNAKLKFKTVW